MEEGAAEFAGMALGVADVRRELAEVREGRGQLAASDPSRRIPEWIKAHHATERGALVRARGVLVDEREGCLEMMVDGFARDEQPHDLG